jgi:hypothetical protein
LCRRQAQKLLEASARFWTTSKRCISSHTAPKLQFEIWADGHIQPEKKGRSRPSRKGAYISILSLSEVDVHICSLETRGRGRRNKGQAAEVQRVRCRSFLQCSAAFSAASHVLYSLLGESSDEDSGDSDW